MNKLSDMIGKKVTVAIKDCDDIDGTLTSIDDGGYFIQCSNDSDYFIPEANNVVYVRYDKEQS